MGGRPAYDKGQVPLALTYENMEIVLEELREDLGHIFGYDPECRESGITGKIDLAEIEGPIVYVSFSGEFWHKRVDVLSRSGTFIKFRIPEIAEVEISDPSML